MLQIAILGFGVVGSGTAEVLSKNQKQVAAYCGEEVNVKYILDLRDFPDHPLGNRVVRDINVILNDPEVVLVAEMMGGAHPAYDFTYAALKAGKHVVTSNKEVVATFGVELLELARQNQVSYLFEGSVGGGIPIIRPMQTDLASNEILSVSGILNGTTNFILTKMKNEGAAFADALKLAQEKGYAEANPAADVEGLDAARKIVILAALAFGKLLDPNKITTTGITGITPEHTTLADKLGCAVKLIAHTEKIDGRVLALVSPFLVLPQNPMSHIDDVYNGIMVDTNALGRALFYGAGAGKLPTASAIVADMLDILSGRSQGRRMPRWAVADDADIADAATFSCRHAYVFEGCPKCEANAKAALASKDSVWLGERKFAVISAKMTAAAADAAIKEAGLSPIITLPILE